MVIYPGVTIGGTAVYDIKRLTVIKSIGDNNSTSSFELVIPNRAGMNKSKYNIGDEVVVYVSSGGDPLSSIFTYTFDFTFQDTSTLEKIGLFILEDIDFGGRENDEWITLRGRDYTSLMMDSTIEPVVYTSQEVSLIVKDIMANEVSDVATTGVQATTVTLARKQYNHTNAFDAIKELAAIVDYYFYIDENKVLYFVPKESVSSGYTLDNSNVTASDFNNSTQDMVNTIWVYGDRTLVASPTQTFIGDGAGSVFTLTDNPHNTVVTVSGAQKKGGVLDIISVPISGQDYLVDYNDKQIVFTSGTAAGYNIPGSLVNINVDYQISRPIAKTGVNNASVNAYKKRELVINDKSIKDPSTARDIVTQTLAQKSLPFVEGRLSVNGVVSVVAGQTVLVNLPYKNQSNQTYTVLEARYNFNPKTMLSGDVLELRLSSKINNLVDKIKQLALDIKKLQAQDLSTSDTISRLESAEVSGGFIANIWYIKTRTLGSSFIWGRSQLGSPYVPQKYLGDSRSAFTIIASGVET